MSRIVRQFLFASLIASHAAVVLCGPCLHGLPGSTHEVRAASSSNAPDHPLQSGTDTKDGCLICHFVAQGQLPVECCSQISVIAIGELPAPSVPAVSLVHTHIPSSPRAPPKSVQG